MSINIVKIKIDGSELDVREGTTILKAAKDNGIIIPTLCTVEGLTAYGGCRLCLVEVSGTPKLFPACTTPVSTRNGSYNQYRQTQRIPKNGSSNALS